MLLLKRIYRWRFTCFLLTVMTLLGCERFGLNKPENLGQKKPISFQEIKNDFSQPDMMYAPFMYWFWDAPLDVPQVVTMTEEMCRQRLNPGYFMAREKRGHGIPHEQWLSPLWFQAISAATNKARSQQFYMGYCDEYKWPSGEADGRVLKAQPDLAAISLKWEITEVKEAQTITLPESFFTVAAEIMDPDTTLGTKIMIKSSTLQVIGSGSSSSWKAAKGNWRIYSFTKYHQRGIDGGEVNYLDRRLAQSFINIAHESYAKTWGKKLNQSLAGVFVDHEGDYGYKLAWSEDLAKEYKHKKGYDIRSRMPLLIDEDGEGQWAKARWDWYDVVSDIYVNSFIVGVNRWLEDRGLYYVSNFWEENLINQAVLVGDFFKAQRAVTLPGNDALFSRALNVHDFKETQSVAEFENRRFMSEILGVSGWGMTPILMKQAVNSTIAWGVNHIVPHGINLNRNLNHAPYPPDWFTSNPYWPYLHHWNDFSRRASYINSYGHLVPEVLLLNPMDSVWGLLGDELFDFNRGKSNYGYNPLQAETHDQLCRYGKTIDHIETVYATAIKELTDARVEYLIADSYYFRQMKSARQGQLLRKPFEFKTLIIPSLVMLPMDIARKILDFASNGGHVYLLGTLPRWSTDHGVNDPEMMRLMDQLEKLPNVKRTNGGIKQLLAEKTPYITSKVVFESGDFPMLQLHRRIDGRDFFWLANNTGCEQRSTVLVQSLSGQASIWNCENGTITEIRSAVSKSGTNVMLEFEPYEAFWLVIDPRAGVMKTETVTRNTWTPLDTLAGQWIVRIDTAAQPTPVGTRPEIPTGLVSQIGIERPLESWTRWGLKAFTGYVDYSTKVVLPTASGPLKLDLGNVQHMAEVWVNGNWIDHKLWPPFTFDLGQALHPGENTIKIRIGNLLSNAMKQEGEAGLFGPIVLLQSNTQNNGAAK